MEKNYGTMTLDQFGEFMTDMTSDETTPTEKETGNEFTLDNTEEDEQVEEQDLPTTQEEEPTPTEPSQKESLFKYKNLINNLLDSGGWQDLSLEHEGVTYDNLKDFSEKVDVDDELFQALIVNQAEAKENALKEKAIVLGDKVDDTRKKIIEAIASGLPHEQILNTHDNFIEPLKRMNLDNEQEAINLLAHYYTNTKGYDDDVVKFKIEKHIKDLNVETTAKEIKKEYLDSFEAILEEEKIKLKETQKSEEERLKNSKKETRDLLKENQYQDNFIKKGVDFLYNINNNGEPDWQIEVKKRLEESKEFQVDFIHFMLDKEDYINKKRASKKVHDTIRVLSTADLKAKNLKQTNPNNTDTPEDESNKEFFGLPVNVRT